MPKADLSRAVALLPIVFRVAVRVGCRAKYAATTLSDIRIQLALVLIKHDNAGTIAQVIVLSIAARKATIGQKHLIIHRRIVVVMVVTAEDSHHISTLFEGRKHAAIETR